MGNSWSHHQKVLGEAFPGTYPLHPPGRMGLAELWRKRDPRDRKAKDEVAYVLFQRGNTRPPRTEGFLPLKDVPNLDMEWIEPTQRIPYNFETTSDTALYLAASSAGAGGFLVDIDKTKQCFASVEFAVYRISGAEKLVIRLEGLELNRAFYKSLVRAGSIYVITAVWVCKSLTVMYTKTAGGEVSVKVPGATFGCGIKHEGTTASKTSSESDMVFLVETSKVKFKVGPRMAIFRVIYPGLPYRSMGSVLWPREEGSVPQPSMISLPQHSVGSVLRPSMGSIAQPSMRSLPQRSVRSIAQRSVESVLRPSMGGIAQPSMRSLPQRSVRSLPQRSVGSVLRPSMGSIAQPSMWRLPQRSVGSVRKATVESHVPEVAVVSLVPFSLGRTKRSGAKRAERALLHNSDT